MAAAGSIRINCGWKGNCPSTRPVSVTNAASPGPGATLTANGKPMRHVNVASTTTGHAAPAAHRLVGVEIVAPQPADTAPAAPPVPAPPDVPPRPLAPAVPVPPDVPPRPPAPPFPAPPAPPFDPPLPVPAAPTPPFEPALPVPETPVPPLPAPEPPVPALEPPLPVAPAAPIEPLTPPPPALGPPEHAQKTSSVSTAQTIPTTCRSVSRDIDFLLVSTTFASRFGTVHPAEPLAFVGFGPGEKQAAYPNDDLAGVQRLLDVHVRQYIVRHAVVDPVRPVTISEHRVKPDRV